MKSKRPENVVGALVLGLADALYREAENQAPESGQAAAVIALLRHEPGMPIELLRRALGLSHPGTVRLVDRLVASALVHRRPNPNDGRAVALYLTDAGEKSCSAILAARFRQVSRVLDTLEPDERATYERLSEKLLTAFIRDLDHAYSVCRLCDAQVCKDCPVVCALERKGMLDRV